MVEYSKDGPFQDPVVRCDKCSKILLLEQVKRDGLCPHCGARRVKNLLACNEEEFRQMKEWCVDEAFLALFEERSQP